jgi:hypothetical protein
MRDWAAYCAGELPLRKDDEGNVVPIRAVQA